MRLFCSKCGIQLEHRRKAVPGKGIILDLVTPHECEGYSIKANEFDSPTVEDIIAKATPLGKAKLVSRPTDKPNSGQSSFDMGDRRNDVRSAAPKSLLDAMAERKIEPGEPEG